MTLMLNASTLESLLDMPSTVEAVDKIFGDLSRQTAAQPTPTTMHVDSADSRFIVMSAVAADPAIAAVKLLADVPSNADRTLPTQRSMIVLADHLTGAPLAMLDGRVPTKMRTAAATAVATRHLARRDSKVLGLVGAGNLAVAHVEALSCVMDVQRVVVWSRTEARIEQFKKAVARFDVDVVSVPELEEVFTQSDVVCTLTPSVEPIIKGEWFREGMHINAVGARPRPTEREIDSQGMARAKVFVDHLGTAQSKSGEYLMALAEGAIGENSIAGELGAVVAGALPGRGHENDITLFNSVGIGALDLAIGSIALERAVKRGLGVELDLSL
ncbi:ornithine cyclodeaminase family protein [Glutamicibacter sp. NPDC087344]|uniref:ornithine cyclodeaminase family protein n=1 Tax=Glutamicibacter sp. NPDC087344 TaxID=3363994 RepID=UPI0038257349